MKRLKYILLHNTLQKTKFHYVYIVINTINGKQYIGDHSTYNLNDTYFGSGTCLKIAFKKYGKQNFKRHILEFFPTKQEAFNAQEKYIILYNTISPKGYNINLKGGCILCGNYEKGRTEKSKEKNKIAQTNRKYTEEARQIMRISHLGEKHTEERTEKIAKKHKGMKYNTSGHSLTILEGRKRFSIETIQKMSKSKIKYWEEKRNKKSA